MRIDELTHIIAKVKKTTFTEMGFTRSNIFFIEGDQYFISYLKKN